MFKIGQAQSLKITNKDGEEFDLTGYATVDINFEHHPVTNHIISKTVNVNVNKEYEWWFKDVKLEHSHQVFHPIKLHKELKFLRDIMKYTKKTTRVHKIKTRITELVTELKLYGIEIKP